MQSVDYLSERCNPIFPLYHEMEPLLLETRRALFSDLDSTSPYLTSLAREVLESKIASATYPPLGEMLPWVLADLARARPDKLPEVARGWLGIYLYGHLLDERADRGMSLSSDEQLLACLLLQGGLRDLHSVVHGTPQARILDLQLSNAVRYQLADLRQNSQAYAPDREEYSREKNSSFVACAAAVAAVCDTGAEEIVQFASSVRLALQLLDDLADWKEDVSTNNHTVLLSRALESVPSVSAQLQSMDPREALTLALKSRAIEYVLLRASEVLGKAVHDLGAAPDHSENRSRRFFAALLSELHSTHEYVTDARVRLQALTPGASALRTPILDGVEARLTLVAQGT